MQITSENGLKNALVYQKLWQKEVMDQNYYLFLCTFSPFLVENDVFRGIFSHWRSELLYVLCFWNQGSLQYEYEGML